MVNDRRDPVPLHSELLSDVVRRQTVDDGANVVSHGEGWSAGQLHTLHTSLDALKNNIML